MRIACVLLLAAALSACYQSSLPLGPPERGTIDRALVGSWSCVDPKDATNRAVVTSRALDAHRYEVEWREEPDHVTHYRAFATRIGSEALLNVEEVGPDRTDRRFAFLRARRDRPFLARVPVMVLTAHPFHHRMIDGLGATVVVRKPYNLDDLLDAVATMCAGEAGQESAC